MKRYDMIMNEIKNNKHNEKYKDITFRELRNMKFEKIEKEIPYDEFHYLVNLYNMGIEESVGVAGLSEAPILKALKLI